MSDSNERLYTVFGSSRGFVHKDGGYFLGETVCLRNLSWTEAVRAAANFKVEGMKERESLRAGNGEYDPQEWECSVVEQVERIGPGNDRNIALNDQSDTLAGITFKVWVQERDEAEALAEAAVREQDKEQRRKDYERLRKEFA